MKRTLLTIGVVLYSIVTAQAQSRVTPDSQPRIGTSSPQLNPPRGRLGHLGSVPTPSAGVPPVITGYSPLFGPPGTALTILGKGFGRPSTDSYVHILSAVTNTYTEWPSTNWNDTEIVVSVPSTMPLGKVFLIVEVNDVHSPDWHPFTVGVPPQITGYSAAYGDPGTVLTIHGTRFGPPLGSSNVSVLSSVTHTFTTWPATSWSDTQIVVSVPSATPLGKVYLYVLANRLASIGTYPFTVGDPPDITGYSVGYGDPGTVLTIHGTGFGTRQGSSAVFVLSAVTNTFTTWPAMSWSDTQILVPVPSTMPLGKAYLNVSVDGLASIGTYPFEVQ